MWSSNSRAILAAFTAYTRLPLWRWVQLEKQDYERAALWWPLVGLVTGGLMALTYTLTCLILPSSIALILALCSRLLFTSAFHEDGLGDFFDGFGGGRSKEKILSIMKDSHIGSYGTIAFILYYLILWEGLQYIPPMFLIGSFVFGDFVGKYLSSFQIRMLPYARGESESKLGVVYASSNRTSAVVLTLMAIVLFFYSFGILFLPALVLTIATATLLIYYIYRKIGGYTGDCCGAIALLTELSWYIGVVAVCFEDQY